MCNVRSKGKCTYSLIKGLYGELERARREHEAREGGAVDADDGASAYELWLELLDITLWKLEPDDVGDGDMALSDGSSSDGPGEDGPDADDGEHGQNADLPQLGLPLGGAGTEEPAPSGADAVGAAAQRPAGHPTNGVGMTRIGIKTRKVVTE